MTKSDVREILNITDNDLKSVAFKTIDGNDAIDERQIQKIKYDNKIPNAIAVEKSSLDELLLILQ